MKVLMIVIIIIIIIQVLLMWWEQHLLIPSTSGDDIEIYEAINIFSTNGNWNEECLLRKRLKNKNICK